MAIIKCFGTNTELFDNGHMASVWITTWLNIIAPPSLTNRLRANSLRSNWGHLQASLG
jgi:hypothetical protein